MGTTLRLLRAGPIHIHLHRDRARVSVARPCRKASRQPAQTITTRTVTLTLDTRRLHSVLLPCLRRGAEELRPIRTNRQTTTLVGTSSGRRCAERRWAAPAAAARTAARAGSASASVSRITAAVRHSARVSVVAAEDGERVWQRRMEPAAVEKHCTGIIIITTGGPQQRGKKSRLYRLYRVLRGDE